MERWIPISEKYHLPWHIKSLPLNVLFDQGIVGLTIFIVLLATALCRLTYGRARYDPLAPCLAAGIIGFIVVGLFDSLLDVPRLAFLFYLLVLASLSLSAPRPPVPPRNYGRVPA
jgi:O-antigen ligase